MFSIECATYCTIGVITKENFWEMITTYPEMKQQVIDQIIQNPHDHERESFVKLCSENIDYF